MSTLWVGHCPVFLVVARAPRSPSPLSSHTSLKARNFLLSLAKISPSPSHSVAPLCPLLAVHPRRQLPSTNSVKLCPSCTSEPCQPGHDPSHRPASRCRRVPKPPLPATSSTTASSNQRLGPPQRRWASHCRNAPPRTSSRPPQPPDDSLTGIPLRLKRAATDNPTPVSPSPHLKLGSPHSGATLAPPSQIVCAASSLDSGRRRRLPAPWLCCPLFRLNGPPTQERLGQFGCAGQFRPKGTVTLSLFSFRFNSTKFKLKFQTLENCSNSNKFNKIINSIPYFEFKHNIWNKIVK
jgi:hypothetical protein